MREETYYPDISMTNPETLAAAIALARPNITKEGPTLDDLALPPKGEQIAQRAIMDFYATSLGKQREPGVKGIMMNPVPIWEAMEAIVVPETLKRDENKDQIILLAPVSRTLSVVVSGADMVLFDATKEDNLPPVPRLTTSTQTSGRGCGFKISITVFIE